MCIYQSMQWRILHVLRLGVLWCMVQYEFATPALSQYSLDWIRVRMGDHVHWNLLPSNWCQLLPFWVR